MIVRHRYAMDLELWKILTGGEKREHESSRLRIDGRREYGEIDVNAADIAALHGGSK